MGDWSQFREYGLLSIPFPMVVLGNGLREYKYINFNIMDLSDKLGASYLYFYGHIEQRNKCHTEMTNHILIGMEHEKVFVVNLSSCSITQRNVIFGLTGTILLLFMAFL